MRDEIESPDDVSFLHCEHSLNVLSSRALYGSMLENFSIIYIFFKKNSLSKSILIHVIYYVNVKVIALLYNVRLLFLSPYVCLILSDGSNLTVQNEIIGTIHNDILNKLISY